MRACDVCDECVRAPPRSSALEGIATVTNAETACEGGGLCASVREYGDVRGEKGERERGGEREGGRETDRDRDLTESQRERPRKRRRDRHSG